MRARRLFLRPAVGAIERAHTLPVLSAIQLPACIFYSTALLHPSAAGEGDYDAEPLVEGDLGGTPVPLPEGDEKGEACDSRGQAVAACDSGGQAESSGLEWADMHEWDSLEFAFLQ
jgi:hypothetical protein